MVCLLVLGGCMIAGIDLRTELLRALDRWLGEYQMLRFVRGVIVPHGIAVRGPCPGPTCLLYVLPAMHLAPRRWAAWHWGGVVCVPLVAPLFWWEWAKWSQRTFLQHLTLTYALGCLAFAVVFLALILYVSRSRRVLARVAIATFVACSLSTFLEWQFDLGGQWPGPWFPVVAACWHVFSAAILLHWALAERLGYRPALGRCEHCEYDLAATPAVTLCPECGQSTQVLPSPGPR